MENTTSKAAYLITGIGIGVAVSILFAPKSGRETREFLKQKTDDCVQRTGRYMQGLVDRGKQVISNERESISDAVRAGREAYRSHHARPDGRSVERRAVAGSPRD